MATAGDGDLDGEDGLIHLNGIDGETGGYLAPPLPIAEAGTLAAGRPPDAEAAGLLRRFWDALKRPFRGLPDDVEPTDPASAGWAVVFAADVPLEVRAALEPL